jgi:peptidoglycan-associated lipoprotein
MNKFKLYSMLVLGVALAVSSTSCKRRPKAGADGTDGISAIRGLPGDNIYGEELGPRFGEEGGILEGEFQAVLFAYDSSQISETERAKLVQVADHMRRYPTDRLIVEGHCDERGSREYNLSLGERRALAARAYLIGLGVDASRLQTRSFGSERPAAFGSNEEAWSQNRRAEFVVVQ